MDDNLPEDYMTPPYFKRAMKAFKKRLKLTRLDQESSLGVGPLSGGRGADIVAIRPPDRYPRECWEELVKLGRLRDGGHGTYSLPDPKLDD